MYKNHPICLEFAWYIYVLRKLQFSVYNVRAIFRSANTFWRNVLKMPSAYFYYHHFSQNSSTIKICSPFLNCLTLFNCKYGPPRISLIVHVQGLENKFGYETVLSPADKISGILKEEIIVWLRIYFSILDTFLNLKLIRVKNRSFTNWKIVKLCIKNYFYLIG